MHSAVWMPWSWEGRREGGRFWTPRKSMWRGSIQEQMNAGDHWKSLAILVQWPSACMTRSLRICKRDMSEEASLHSLASQDRLSQNCTICCIMSCRQHLDWRQLLLWKWRLQSHHWRLQHRRRTFVWRNSQIIPQHCSVTVTLDILLIRVFFKSNLL